jgi:hypothetical protein
MSLPEMTLDQEPPIVTSEGETIPAVADPDPAASLTLPPVQISQAPADPAKGRRRVTQVYAGDAASGSRTPARRHARRGQPDEDEWTEFFSKYALEWLMSAYIWVCFRGVDWSRLDPDFKDGLYADEEDVATIAEALATFTHGTSFSRRYGRKVVGSAALLDAGHALVMWGITVQRSAVRVRKAQGVTAPPLIPRRAKHEKTAPGEIHRIERNTGNVGRSQAAQTAREGNGELSDQPVIPIRIVNPGGA